MIGVIITGHGYFADGLVSAMEVITGKQKKVKTVNFLAGDTSEILQANLIKAVSELECETIVFLTDIAGGSPFNQSVLLGKSLQQEGGVFSGTNVPFLLEVIFSREIDDLFTLQRNWLASEQIRIQVYSEQKKTVCAQQFGGI